MQTKQFCKINHIKSSFIFQKPQIMEELTFIVFRDTPAPH